ncbi:MAG TPA: YihY/virulence factor BrkB family protein [Saprospiraceae bacterium]|nr:YihY/virulence factor BrkB family protein [Saprospiraceae bacterium]HMQ85020.1 YihY/virulence factor BrkB family protein [Saprospiraceae bacterium]
MKRINFKELQSFILKWQEHVLAWPPIKRLIDWSKEKSLPGFFKVPIYDVVVFLYHETRRYDLFTRSNAIAFSFFLALFPALMAFFTLIPLFKNYLIAYFPAGENFDVYLRLEIQRIMPGIAGDRLFSFIDDVTNNPRFGLLSFGFFLAMYFSSNGMLALMRGFEKSYMQTFKKRSGWRKRLVSALLTFQLGILLIAAILLIILGEWFIHLLNDYLPLDWITNFSLRLLRWLSIIFLFYTSISIIYRYGAATKKRFTMFSPGATLATILCLLSSLAFSKYVNDFSTYNELYGSIGAIIVLMLWIQINALIILIGFELNASIAVNRDIKLEKEEEAL